MTTDIYKTITELFKDATKQLDSLVEQLSLSDRGNTARLTVLENIKTDLHTYSTEVAMFLVSTSKEAGLLTPGKYDEISGKVKGIVSRALQY